MVAAGSASRIARAVAEARAVLRHVRLGPPEEDVRFIPDLPDDAATLVMLRGGGRPARKRRHAFRMLRGRRVALLVAADGIPRELLVLVERVRVIQNIQRPQSASLQVGGQFVVGREIMLPAPALDAGPAKIHANEFEAGLPDQIEVPLVPAHEMDVHAHALRQNQRRQISGANRPDAPAQQKHCKPQANHSPAMLLQPRQPGQRRRPPF